MMNHEPDKNLERLIHRQLRALPDLSAPNELIPNVLAAIQARALKPWYASPWMTWPITLRLASALLFFGALTAAVVFGRDILHSIWQILGNPFSALEPIGQSIVALGNALALVLRSMQLQLIIAISFFGFLYLTCIGMGTVFFRIVLRRN